jgi:hypothetical protein
MSHQSATPIKAPSADSESSLVTAASMPTFIDPAGRSALTVAGALAVGVAGLLLYAAAITLHPGWIIPLAEVGVLAVFAALFAATR